ncbi:hypothetical protein ACQR0Z_17465 [Bradyrhizobium sp. HKCCYLS3077]|uniref:hypothetical protein n=1 Tax=Bradyrhizobium sp. HKCCYLS3077 TaxID=3420761 RepID=UPI003EB989A8
MATLLDLAREGALLKFDPLLEHPQQELRMFHAGPKLVSWIQNDLPKLESNWKIEQRPDEQLDDLLQLFCSGEPLIVGWQFKSLVHLADGVWELKTPDLRIFGWFHRKDCFIGVIADTAERTKTYKLYAGYARVEVAKFRDGLDLDEPKFVPGADPHDVVSNCYFP